MRFGRAVLVWTAVALLVVLPLGAASGSPLLQWRQPVYIAAGFAGIVAMAFLLLQPLLAGGYLPGLEGRRGRGIHRWIGSLLVVAVLAHVGGLWMTSPPDVLDALLFRSPTPFSVWGVLAMWTLLAAALVALAGRRLRLSPRLWQKLHTCLAFVVVAGSALHAVLIEGTMEPVTKALLCLAALAATVKVAIDRRVWDLRFRAFRGRSKG